MAVRRNMAGTRTENTGDGFVVREVFEVDGLTGTDFGQIAYTGLLDPLAPKRGDSLVLDPSGPNERTLTCITVVPETVTNERTSPTPLAKMRAVATFAEANATVIVNDPDDDGPGVATVGAQVENVQTEKDKDDVVITVKKDATSPNIIHPVDFRRSRPVVEFSRLEASNPRDRARTHVGTLNNAIWNGFAIETVLCTGIIGTTRDGGNSYDVRYAFEVDEGTDKWDVDVYYIDDNGRPLANPVDGVSKKTVKLYKTSNFGALNISL